jgi:hypothetical protein
MLNCGHIWDEVSPPRFIAYERKLFRAHISASQHVRNPSSACMQHERLHLQPGLRLGTLQAAAKLQATAPYHVGPLLVTIPRHKATTMLSMLAQMRIRFCDGAAGCWLAD